MSKHLAYRYVLQDIPDLDNEDFPGTFNQDDETYLLIHGVVSSTFDIMPEHVNGLKNVCMEKNCI